MLSDSFDYYAAVGNKIVGAIIVELTDEVEGPAAQ